MAIMLITHAMGVVAEMAQRVVVMYAGKVVEEAQRRGAVRQPAPSLHAGPDPLDPAHRHRGAAQGAARADPGHGAQADRPGRAAASRRAASSPRADCVAGDAGAARAGRRAQGALHLRHRPEPRAGGAARRSAGMSCTDRAHRCCGSRDLVKHFPIKGGLLGREVEAVHAVDGVSFDLAGRRDARPGRRVGLRQDHDRPLHPAPDRADLGRGLVRRQGRHPAPARTSCARWRATCRSSSRTRTRRSTRA